MKDLFKNKLEAMNLLFIIFELSTLLIGGCSPTMAAGLLAVLGSVVKPLHLITQMGLALFSLKHDNALPVFLILKQ